MGEFRSDISHRFHQQVRTVTSAFLCQYLYVRKLSAAAVTATTGLRFYVKQQSNDSRIQVQAKSNRSCQRRLSDQAFADQNHLDCTRLEVKCFYDIGVKKIRKEERTTENMLSVMRYCSVSPFVRHTRSLHRNG